MKHRKEYEVVVADVEGELYTWVEGTFTGGSQRKLKLIKAYATCGDEGIDTEGVPLSIHGDPVIPSSNTPEGAAAAMTCLSPGRTIIRKAPPRVMELMNLPEDDEGTVRMYDWDEESDEEELSIFSDSYEEDGD